MQIYGDFEGPISPFFGALFGVLVLHHDPSVGLVLWTNGSPQLSFEAIFTTEGLEGASGVCFFFRF